MDWYKHFAVRFLASTAHMSLAARGAYITLLNQQWDRGGYLPSNVDAIVRMVGVSNDEEANVVREVLKEKFRSNRKGFYNRRMLETYKEAQVIVQKRRRAGRKGALAKAKASGQAYAPSLPGVCSDTRASFSCLLQTTSEDGEEVELQPSEIATTSGRVTIAPGVELPDGLRVQQFVEKWSEWLDYRRVDRGKKVSVRAAKGQMKKLAAAGVLKACLAIDDAISNDWQGVFPEKLKNGRADGRDRERAMKQGEDDGWT